MTPEDKIVEAIDRNTNALTTIVWWLAAITGCLLALAISAKATPLLPPLSQPPLYDIGDPPKPPANPHVQYWYTMDVPGPDGVLPVEVFAPRLFSPVASVGPVDVPEPGTWWLVGFITVPMLLGYVLAELSHRRTIRMMKATQRRNALKAEFLDKQLWQFISLDEWLDKNEDTARKALEE